MQPLSSGSRKRLEHAAVELRQLIEEQHAAMGEADLPWLHRRPASDDRAAPRRCDAGRGTDACVQRHASSRRPAIEAIAATSSASALDSGGSRRGKRAASMLLPLPGGPTISTLCPPAAATSSARLACHCPMTCSSAKSATLTSCIERAEIEPARSARAAALHGAHQAAGGRA